MTVRAIAELVVLVALSAASSMVVACHYDWPLPSAGGGDAQATADAQANGEAGVDGGDACAGSLFCDTFDDQVGNPFARAWPDVFISNGSDVHVEAFAGAHSAPNVLISTRAPADMSTHAYASHVVATPTPLARASISLWLRPEQLDPNGARACVAGVVFGDATSAEHVTRVLIGANGATLQDKPQATAGRAFALTTVPATGAWSHVTISAEVNGRIRVLVGDQVAADEAADPTMQASTATRFFVGVNFVEVPSGTFQFRYDDVRGDGSP